MPSLPTTIQLALLGSVLMGISALAEDSPSELDRIQNQFAAHEELTRRPLAELGQKYRDALLKLRDQLQADADLDGLLIVRGEIERFDKAKVPAPEASPLVSVARLQEIYRTEYQEELVKVETALSTARDTYRQKLEGLVQSLTREGKVEAALKVRGVLETLESEKGGGAIELERGLVLHFRFEENSREVVRDSSTANNDGRLRGDARVLSTSGNRGRHVLLDGQGDFIEIPHHESLALTNDGTISLWVRPKRLNNMRGLISKYNPVNSWTMRNWENAQLRKVGFGDHHHNLLSESELKYDQWNHVVATLREGEVAIYLNGKLDAQGTRPGPLSVNDKPVRIGSCYDGRYLDGAVDDVRIYDRGLSPQEVARLFELES